MGDHRQRYPGGFAEIAPDGRVIRTSSAADPAAHSFIRAYSLAIIPRLDRVVTTTSDMHSKGVAETVQLWRLSDLKLLNTIPLHRDRAARSNRIPAEPRVLADGRTVIVNTFNCGLYRMVGLDSDHPSAEFIYDFGTGQCALPVGIRQVRVQTDTGLPELVSVDMSNPSRPRVRRPA